MDNNSPAYRCYPVMGTWAELTLYGSKNVTELAFRKIRKVFNDVNKVCNRFNKQSELSRLNSSAAERPFKCSNLLWKILIDSKFFYELSDGTFDVTVTPLMELWGFYRKQNKIPSEFLIKKTLKQVGLDKVKYNKKNHTVFYTEKGIQIDLGGIAKG
ncbi:MAG: FAD:protein FMN transferase, partial [Victivallales bacterium]|nr:FAD:protein FMN transferase [Victivallales bacterium]